jgi:hypothetical protein
LTEGQPGSRRLYTAVMGLAAVAAYLILALPQTGQSLIIDEAEFPRLAEAIAETGQPVFYRGEESPGQTGVFHPPLYAFLLGFWVKLLGFSPVVVRVFGVLLMLATAWFGYRTLEEIGPKDLEPGFFLVFFLLHPFVLQSALLPDIDGTLLIFAATLLGWTLVRSVARELSLSRQILGVGSALALVLACKLTAVYAIPFVFAVLLIAKGPVRAAKVTAAASVLAAGIFLVVWRLVSWVTDSPFSFPFEFTLQSGLKGGVGDLPLSTALRRLIPADWAMFWLGMPVLLMAAVGTVHVAARWRQEPHRRVLLAFAAWAVGVLALYSLITGPPYGFPKYLVGAMPALAMLAAIPAASGAERLKDLGRWAWAVPVAVVPLVYLLYVQYADGLDTNRYFTHPWFVLLPIGLAAGLVLAVLASRRPDDWIRYSVACLSVAGAALLFSHSFSVDLYQAQQDSSIRYHPSEVGFDRTVARMKELVRPDEPFLAPKDIGSAVYNRFHQQEILFLQDMEVLDRLLANPAVRYAVVRTDWDYSFTVYPEAQPVIERHMQLQETIGDFLIYGRRP